MRRCLVALCVLWILAAAISTAGAQSGITWSASGGFGGLYRESGWLPIVVDVANGGAATQAVLSTDTGQAPLTARGTASGPQAGGGYRQNPPAVGAATYSATVSLPANSRKLITLCVPAGASEVCLQVGRKTYRQQLQLRSAPPEADLVVVVGGDGSALQSLSGKALGPARPGLAGGLPQGLRVPAMLTVPRTEVAHVPWAALPDTWLAWDGVTAVVLADANVSGAPTAAVDALGRWVRLGGTLVVPGGMAGSALAGSPLAPVLPLSIRGVQDFDRLAALGAALGVPPPAGRTLAVSGTPRPEATPVLGEPSAPLVWERRQDAGRVLMPVIDLLTPPVRYWGGQEQLWPLLLRPGSPAAASDLVPPELRGYFASTLDAIVRLVPQSRSAPVALIVIFLGIYLLILSPGQYLLVNRLRRRELAWALTPLIVLVFTLTAYGLARLSRGTEGVFQRVAVVRAESDATAARAEAWLGVFSPRARRYSIVTGEGAAGAAVMAEGDGGGTTATVSGGQAPQIANLSVAMWAARSCRLECLVELGGGLRIEQAIFDGGSARVRVTNNTPYAISYYALCRPGEKVSLEAAGAGSRRGGTASLSYHPAISVGGGGHGSSSSSGSGKGLFAGGARVDLQAQAQAICDALFTHQFSWQNGSHTESGCPGDGEQLYLVAVTGQPVVPAQLRPRVKREVDATLLLVPLSLRLAAGRPILVPDWLLNRRTTAISYGGASGTQVECRVALAPEGGALTSLGTGPCFGNGLQVYDYGLRDWRPGSPVNGGYNVSSPGTCLGPDGTIRFRYQPYGRDPGLSVQAMIGAPPAGAEKGGRP